jgi:2-polyprenyl-3-methyl-5-hydroxy-6-metoxy-1,4-benzoquinol methylase
MAGHEFNTGRQIVELENADQAALVARRLFPGPSFGSRMQRLRPYICPFHELVRQVPAGSRVLDVGCGSGLFLGLLSSVDRIQSGLGFDASQQAISLATAMAQKLSGAAVSFRHIKVDEKWPDDSFDVVSLIDVMHHIPSSARDHTLRLIADRVRRGGLFIYKDMVTRPLWRATANQIHDLAIARQWIVYEPVDRIEAFCADFGLEALVRKDINMLWYGHQLRVFRRPG